MNPLQFLPSRLYFSLYNSNLDKYNIISLLPVYKSYIETKTHLTDIVYKDIKTNIFKKS